MLSTPTNQRYTQRIEEGFDIEGFSPCFDAYKKLYPKANPDTGKHTQTENEKNPLSTSSTSTDLMGLNLLADVVSQSSNRDAKNKDIVKHGTLVSPALVEAHVCPNATTISKKRKNHLDNLPDNLTSIDCIRTMYLGEFEKIRRFAKKERKAKVKYLSQNSKTGKESRLAREKIKKYSYLKHHKQLIQV